MKFLWFTFWEENSESTDIKSTDYDKLTDDQIEEQKKLEQLQKDKNL